MMVNHFLQIRNGDTVDTLREFLSAWWVQNDIEAMLAPVEIPGEPAVNVRIIEGSAELRTVNPFAPIMLINAAALVENFLRQHPGKRLAIVLRPCELRTLVELRKRHRIPSWSQKDGNAEHQITVIGMDCPGTFPVGVFAEQVVSRGIDELTHQALEYGTRPGFVPHQLRSGCLVCDRPAPVGADMMIGAIGIAPHGFMLVIARDEETDARLQLHAVTDSLATEVQVVRRETAVGALVELNAQNRRKLALARSDDKDSLIGLFGLFARCSLCADCLDACPLYDGELTGMLGVDTPTSGSRPLLPELVSVSRWLASCSGCGMCQEACENDVSLTQLFAMISHQIRGELHYTAGDPFQNLPWVNG